MAALVDTNVVLRQGIANDSLRLPHPAILEFVAAVTRPLRYGTVQTINPFLA